MIRSLPLSALALAIAAGSASAQCGQPTKVLLAPDAAPGNELGGQVCISGDYAILSAPLADHAVYGVDVGRLYMYKRTGGLWNYVDSETPNNVGPGGRLGTSMDYDGTRLIVGAPEASNGNGLALFYSNGVSSIGYDDIVTAPNNSEGFGDSVAIYGGYAAVGAPLADMGGDLNAGRVIVYKYDALNGWLLTAADISETDPIVRTPGSLYGRAIAMYGTNIYVGVPYGNFDGVANVAKGYIARWVKGAGDTWTLSQRFTAPDVAQDDRFGDAIDSNVNYIVVGAPRANLPAGTDAGAAYCFRLVNNQYLFDGKLTPADGEANGYFGSSVAISGTRIIVGAPGAKKSYIFRRTAAGTWVQDFMHTDPIGVPAKFGTSVSISGDDFLVGDPSDQLGGSNAGAAYLYNTDPLQIHASDTCAGANTVSTGAYYGCTITATVDGISTCGNGGTGNGGDVWYRYDAACTGQVVIDTQGSALDTVLSVHSGCPATEQNSIACNDDFAVPERWSRIMLNVTAGQSYYIRIAGYDHQVNSYTLHIGACSNCYANCDGSSATPMLNVNDYVCFNNRFAAADPYANCDASTNPPVLNVNDFVCFMNKYSIGCP